MTRRSINEKEMVSPVLVGIAAATPTEARTPKPIAPKAQLSICLDFAFSSILSQ
jgi:hypothetical protein